MISFTDLSEDKVEYLKNKRAELEAFGRMFLGVVFLLLLLIYSVMGMIDGFLNKLYVVLGLLTVIAIGIKLDDRKRIRNQGNEKQSIVSKIITTITPVILSLIFLLSFSVLITASQLSVNKILNNSLNISTISSIDAFKIALLIIGLSYIASGLFRLSYKNYALDSLKGKRLNNFYTYSSGFVIIFSTVFLLDLEYQMIFLYAFVLYILVSQNNKSWEKSIMFINLSQFNDSEENTRKIVFKDEITITTTQYFMLFRYNGNTYQDLTYKNSVSSGLLCSLYIFQTVFEILYQKEINKSDYKSLGLKDNVILSTKLKLNAKNSSKGD